jgi:hypothetical protein
MATVSAQRLQESGKKRWIDAPWLRDGRVRYRRTHGAAPKSEAWLLCALRPPGYANCALLEDASGNDASPNSLKQQLAALSGGTDPSADEQADWVVTGAVDPLRIDMPSFNAFKQALHTAAQNAGWPLLP